MAADNKALIRRWFEEVWNQGRADVIDELLAPDGVARGLGEGGRDLVGPAAFKEFFALYRGAFPDIRITIEDVVAEGDLTAARFSGTATHAGDDLGIPASGRPVAFTGMTFTRWRDGRIVEGWNNFDVMGLMQQVGAVQPMRTLA